MHKHGSREPTTTDQHRPHPEPTNKPGSATGTDASGSTARAIPLTTDHRKLVDLLRDIGEGDKEAFTTFYHLTVRRTYGLARRVLVNSELAQDTTQEIYLIVWQDAHKYNPTVGNPMAWLMTITHRRSVDKVRSEHSSATRNTHYAVANHTPDYDSVAETATARVEAQSVATCLATLTPIQRQTIHLAYYNSLTYRQVSEHLSVPLPTIKTRIRNGLTQLRLCLDGNSCR